MISLKNTKHALSSLVRYCYKSMFCDGVKHTPCQKCLFKQRILLPFVTHDLKISTSCKTSKKHTTKNWKFMIRDGKTPSKFISDDTEPFKCEEGSEAISHAQLIAELQNCSSVSNQVEKFCSMMSLSSDEIERRTELCQYLNEAFKIYFPQFETYQFGSSVNGLGFKGCDLDICIRTNFSSEECVKVLEVPTLQSVIDGGVSKDTISRLDSYILLRFIRRIIREHCPDVNENILLIKAKCPLLRFYSRKHNVFCDFSTATVDSVRNTMLIRLFCNLSNTFTSVAKIIRYWGKCGGFVGDIDMFNSYSFALLVVHFLQTRSPAILPPTDEIVAKSDYIKQGRVSDYDLLREDVKKFSASSNTQTINELLREFFFYYLTWDFSRVMLLRSGSSAPKKFYKEKDPEFQFGNINLQDPFRTSFNPTLAASDRTCRRFVNCLLQTCEAYQTPSCWTPGTDDWGLNSVFNLPVLDVKVLDKRRETCLYTIELPPIPDGAAKLRRVLEHGLMFSCADFYAPSRKDGSVSLLKLRCKAYHKVWQGRGTLHASCACATSDKSVLETEHLISKELISESEDLTGRREVLTEFNCEYVEQLEHRTSTVLLNFKESKYKTVLGMFLKEYLPRILWQL